MNNNQMTKEEKEKFISLQNEKLLKFVKLNNMIKVESAIRNGADIAYQENTALEYALIENNKEMVQLLINYGISLSKFGNKVLKKMLKEHQFEMAKFLIENGVNIHGANDTVTPLVYCVENNNVKAVEFLLTHHVDIQTNNNKALCEALENGDFKMMECLIAHGAQLNEEGNGPLKTAINIKEARREMPTSLDEKLTYRLKLISKYNLKYEKINKGCYDLNGNEIDVLDYLLSRFTVDLNKLESNNEIDEEIKTKLISDLFHSKLQNELEDKEVMRKNKL